VEVDFSHFKPEDIRAFLNKQTRGKEFTHKFLNLYFTLCRIHPCHQLLFAMSDEPLTTKGRKFQNRKYKNAHYDNRLNLFDEIKGGLL